MADPPFDYKAVLPTATRYTRLGPRPSSGHRLRPAAIFTAPPTALVRLRARLYDVIHLAEDQVIFLPLCQRCAGLIESLGRPIEAHDARDLVVVV